MIFLYATTSNAHALNNIFKQPLNTVGLQINQLKSKVYFSKDVTNKDQLLNTLGMSDDILPVKYRGVPLSTYYIIHHIVHHLFLRCLISLRDRIVLCYQLQGEMN